METGGLYLKEPAGASPDLGDTQWEGISQIVTVPAAQKETGDNSDPDEHKGRRRARNVAAQRGKSSHGVNKVPPENKENEEEEEDQSLNEPVTRHSC